MNKHYVPGEIVVHCSWNLENEKMEDLSIILASGRLRPFKSDVRRSCFETLELCSWRAFPSSLMDDDSYFQSVWRP